MNFNCRPLFSLLSCPEKSENTAQSRYLLPRDKNKYLGGKKRKEEINGSPEDEDAKNRMYRKTILRSVPELKNIFYCFPTVHFSF